MRDYIPREVKQLQVPPSLFGPFGRKRLNADRLRARYKIAQGPESLDPPEPPKEPVRPKPAGDLNAPQPRKVSPQERMNQPPPSSAPVSQTSKPAQPSQNAGEEPDDSNDESWLDEMNAWEASQDLSESYASLGRHEEENPAEEEAQSLDEMKSRMSTEEQTITDKWVKETRDAIYRWADKHFPIRNYQDTEKEDYAQDIAYTTLEVANNDMYHQFTQAMKKYIFAWALEAARDVWDQTRGKE